MNYEHYFQKDEAEVVALWNLCCSFDAITIQKFRRQALFDENFDRSLSWVARNNQCITGFAYATKRIFPYYERGLQAEQGWINVLFVHPEYRNQGIGDTLLQKCEEALIEKGATEIILGAYSPNYFFYGVDEEHYPQAAAFFKAHGYQSGNRHYSMGRDLHGYQISQETLLKMKALQEEGYSFAPFSYPYSLKLLEFARKEFVGWKHHLLVCLQKGKAEERIVLALYKDQVVGFALRATDDNDMRFGPIGIQSELRNKGIGGVLLEYQLYEMSKRGIYRMFFMTTDEPGKRYYQRHGLQVIRCFKEYWKELFVD